MQTVSLRIPEDDLAWLAGLGSIEGSSPSDKIRGLIAEGRRRMAGEQDYMTCLAVMREALKASEEGVLAIEHRHGRHSELLALLFARLPELMALLVAGLPHHPVEDGHENEALEAAGVAENRLAMGTMRLLTSILRLAITPQAPTYDAGLFEPLLPEVIELAGLVRATRTGKEA